MSRNAPKSYTAWARWIALKYPYFSSVSIQMNFWTIAYVLLFSIIFLGVSGISKNMGLELTLHFGPPLLMSIFLGLSYGFVIGTLYHLMEGNVYSNRPMWQLITFQAIMSMLVLLTLVFISRTYIFVKLVRFFSVTNVFDETQNGWPYLFGLIVIYTFMMTLLISFINQMNRKFGPGILIPMLLGRFRKPREEERIFMFLDLKNSTSLAEKLGHVQYSSFVRDCFQDINKVVQKYFAEIYQYVGDEIVLSWIPNEGFRDNSIIEFYFSCKAQFKKKEDYYLKNYTEVPEFKAGVHLGLVTVVEVGDIKRDIAYHGDTLNVASRIEKLCKEKDEEILMSYSVYEKLEKSSKFYFKNLGIQNLKGRQTALEVFNAKPKSI